MVETKRPAPWPVRVPDSEENRTKAKQIADAKGVKFNALIASYVVEGLQRDWNELQNPTLHNAAYNAMVKQAQSTVDIALGRSEVSPNFKGKS